MYSNYLGIPGDGLPYIAQDTETKEYFVYDENGELRLRTFDRILSKGTMWDLHNMQTMRLEYERQYSELLW